LKNKILILITALFTAGFSFSQLIIGPQLTPLEYVQNIVGPGIIVSNVTFSADNSNQIGAFSGGSNIGYSSGVVLCTGDVNEIEGVGSAIVPGQDFISPTGPTDPDLLEIAQSVTTNPDANSIDATDDLVELEFDFVAESNVVNFSFVFASDEYSPFGYENTLFNDIFGFFVSGPGITGPYNSPAGFPNGAANLAVVPGTNIPITISTIYPYLSPSEPGLNSQYYIDNSAGTTHAFNGFTTPIPITFNVICGQTYHFKFAVADCQDDYLSTAVFLQDGSFSSPPVDLSLQTANGTDTIPEACIGAEVLFIRSACQSSDSLEVNFTVSGTATVGVDYNLAASPIIMLPGQDTASISITPIIDNFPEGTESIIISISFLNSNGQTVVISGTIYLTDIQPVVINESDLQFQCFDNSIELTAIASGGSGSFTYDWAASNSDSIHDYVSILENGTFDYIINVTDACLGIFSDTATVIMNKTLVIDTMGTEPSTCQPTGVVWGLATGTTGIPSYNWTGPGPNNPNFINASVWENISSGWYYFTVNDVVCSVNDSVYVDLLDPPVASFEATPLSGCSPLEVTITNNSENSTAYLWNLGDGTTNVTTNLNGFNHTFTDQTMNQSFVIQLIAQQGVFCSDTSTIVITTNICGCTNTEADNYNPNATLDDGSCIFPNPIIEAPNVFTPNQDGLNDVFVLKWQNLKSLRLIIINRWGNVIYDETSEDLINKVPSWNGSGAQEGVYFYKYEGFGITDQELEGHGFIHLVRSEN
jgi:gliding motility-associated-like protein